MKIVCTEAEEKEMRENCKWLGECDYCVLSGICRSTAHPLEGVEIEVVRDG